MATWRRTASAAPDRHCSDSISQEQEQKDVLSRSGLPVNQRPAQFAQIVAANLFRPLADRGESPRREGHPGRGTSAVVEYRFRAQTTGSGGCGLQRFVTGLAPSLRRRARYRLCSATKVAPKRATAVLFGSHYAPAELNRLRPVWILIHCAVHPSGENLLLSKRLQARKSDSGRTTNCRFQVQAEHVEVGASAPHRRAVPPRDQRQTPSSRILAENWPTGG